MNCPQIFFPMISSSMEAVFEYARKIGCFLHFTTFFQGYVEKCNLDFTIKKCNSTGLSISVSESVRTLCEDPAITSMTQSKNTLYRNVMCDVCNSDVLEDPIAQCNATGKWKLLNRAFQDLAFYQSKCANDPISVNTYPFKNMNCEDCNGLIIYNDEFEVKDLEKSYRQLFSILEIPRTENRNSIDICNPGEMYDSYSDICRQLHCSPGKFLLKGSCQPLMKDILILRYTLAFKLFISPELDMTRTLSDIFKNFKLYLATFLPGSYFTILQNHFYVQKPCSTAANSYLRPQVPVEILVYTQIEFTENRADIEDKLLNFAGRKTSVDGFSLYVEENVQAWYLPIRKRFSLSQKECIFHEYHTIEDEPTENFHLIDVNKLLRCPQIQLDDSEFSFRENHLEIFVPLINRNFLIHEFARNKKGHVQICAESYKRTSSERNVLMESVLAVVTLIVTILSLICSFITFVAYCLLPVLRTVPGKNIMCFTLALFFAQLMFLSRSYINNKLACLLVGSLTHYFWISVFVCSNVCCFHMYKLFVGGSLVQSNKSSEWKLMFRNCLMSFVLPTLPIAANIAFQYQEIQIRGFKFGYGGTKCFLISSVALLLTFIVPILIQILINIVIFSITFHYIRTTPKVQSSRDRSEFSIFLKLFILTGISWIFMIVDGFFEISLFTFLATVLNGTQGLFLFVSYICNEKIWAMLKKRWGKALPSQSESTLGRSSQYFQNQSVYSEITEATESTGYTS
nr:uncharacterized protein LOC111121458 isoform X2 [Crassostrea virginica]